jgi:hypothetical protein
MIKWVSFFWNTIALGLSAWAFLSAAAGVMEAQEIFGEYEVKFSTGDVVYAAAFASMMLWLPILVVWAIGAFFLLILKSYGRPRIERYPVARSSRHRIDPRL